MNKEPIDDTFYPPFEKNGFTYHVKKNSVMDKIFSTDKSKSLLVFLDFDGTVVEHQFPDIGRFNFGCEGVIAKLRAKGHKIMLNTMRSEFRMEAHYKSTLDRAMDTLVLYGIEVDTIMGSKLHAPPWLGPTPILDRTGERGAIYIDDQAVNMPLKPAVMTAGNVVDWDKVEADLIAAGIL